MELRQRLAAILAADVAGYSRLMAVDERATVVALDAARAVFRKQIESSQGRIIDMAGDSVLAVFETATGAVSAALSIQNAINSSGHEQPEDRRMLFRIGIHLGDVIEKADGTIYGDGVNIAARLEGLAEPGGITVSESIHTAVRGKVGAAFEDRGGQQVKNIAHPVRAFAVRTEGTTAAKPSRSVGEIDLSLPDKPSIAVLPFANMSGDPEQEYFTDGITEDIITELSRFHSLFVIARNSTFTYKGKAIDVRAVAKDLGVRYVLEGGIRKAANRVRVTAQLIDALTGSHIWAEKYDRVLEDIFAVQEQVTQSIVAAIAPQIHGAEQEKARRRRPENLSAYDLALRAGANANEAYLKSDFQLRERALAEARKALALDPRSTVALNVIAASQGRHLFMFMGAGSDATKAWEEGVAAATETIELDPSGSAGYAWRGMLLSLAGRSTEALANTRRGHELNPNDVGALGNLSFVELMEGQAELALEHLHKAMRISPRDPFHYITNAMRAAACFLLRDHAKGLEYALLSVGAAPNWPIAHTNHVLVAVGAGDIASAKAALEAARRLAPEYIQKRLDGETIYHRPEDRQRVTTALRIAAGLEDPKAAEALR
jgi:adenylate cyclase